MTTISDHASNQKPLNLDDLVQQSLIPPQFTWPDHQKPSPGPVPELQAPVVDLGGFLGGEAAELVGQACRKHGFFVVVNHGVDEGLIAEAYRLMDEFFEQPFEEKNRAERKAGKLSGYASSFIGRFSSNLPWKETLSLHYSSEKGSSSHNVEHYIRTTLGQDHAQMGYETSISINIWFFFLTHHRVSFRVSIKYFIRCIYGCVLIKQSMSLRYFKKIK